jgi:hypothetical protein
MPSNDVIASDVEVVQGGDNLHRMTSVAKFGESDEIGEENCHLGKEFWFQ